MATITETYNNIPHNPGLQDAFGFSCYFHEGRLLFDTGGDGGILLKNLNYLGIDPQDIDMLVLSHDHWDHNGGLAALLEARPDLKVFMPPGISDATADLIKSGGQMVIVEDWQELIPGVFSTGPLQGKVTEQSLAIVVDGGYFVVSGCAHPHISQVLSAVRAHGQVQGVIGGFHDVSEEDLRSLAGIPYLSASHCTKNLEQIIAAYPDTYVKGGCGKVHNI